MRNSLFVVCLAVISLAGCVTSKELVLYQADTTGADTITIPARFVPTIKPGDVLNIQVGSLSPEASSFFNPYQTFTAIEQTRQNTVGTTTPLPPTTGFLVDDAGTIEFPLLGKVAVKGLTVTQTADQIRQKLKEYLKEPTVNVRNLNFQISVLGEVARPSLFNIPNEQITLPAALGLAGDLTIYGQRNDVLLIREEGGKKQFVHLDLTKRDVFKSPYYFLHPNDVVYVPPGKSRLAAADRTYQLLPIVISALSFLAIIASRF